MNRSIGKLALALAIMAMILTTAQMASAQGTTAFTYQGVLKINGKLATGVFDFLFTLYDGPDPVFDDPIGPEEPKSAVEVVNGAFTVMLDFGTGLFNGQELWLQTCVRETGMTMVICLDPLQQINPVPYSTFAINSSELDGLGATDFLRRTSGCEICIGHADNDGGEPAEEQCFDLSTTGRNDGNFLQLSGVVNGDDRLWLWMQCP